MVSRLEGSSNPVYGTKSLYDSQGRSVGSVRYVGSRVAIAADGASTLTTSGTELYRTATEYDSKGRVKSSTDAYGNTTTYTYDKFDRQEIVKQSNGLITKTVYDSQGRVSKSIIEFGTDVRTTEYKYDIYGNISETTQPNGTKISAKYNEKGQKVSETNQLGQTRTFEYDDNGQLIKVTLPEVNGQKPVYEYTYDAQGNQLTIKDLNGHITYFTYDLNGNQLTRTLPDGNSTETFEYDPEGRLLKETSFEGVITTYKYDPYDRLESKTFLDKDGNTETWTYTYDKLGRVSEINQAGRITTTHYDEQGRTKSIETPEGKISYTYDKFGRQTSVKTDNDAPTLYSYDNYGRLKTVKSDGQTTTYEYDAFGNLSKTTTDTGFKRLIATYQYDNMNRLVKLTNFVDVNENNVFDSGEGISEFEYTLNDIGQKTKALEKFWADYDNDGSIDLLLNNIDWEYDSLGRLTSEVFDHYANENDQTSTWEYDVVGNRLRQEVDKGNNGTIDNVTTYEYDENDRLLKEEFDGDNNGTFEKQTYYGYDHTQQTSKIVSENGVLVSETAFEYDVQGRMSVVTITTFDENGAKTRIERTAYEYGADGIRVSALHEIDEDGNGTFDTSKLTTYLNDPLNITGYSQVLKQVETDLTTDEQTHIIYVIGHQRISQIVTDKNSNQQEYYFTFDGHGSTRVLLDFAGAIAQLYAFDAYGNAIGFNPSEALTEFLYSGEQFDAKIGQQYLRARYYDPATGRFNRLDPFFGNVSDPQSFHKYLYTHANPVNGIDPSGNMTVGTMMVSIGNMMNMTIRVMNVASRIYNVASTLHFIGELYSQFAYGGIATTIRNELWNVTSQWGKIPSNTVTSKLFEGELWADASRFLTDNLSRIMVHIATSGGSLVKNMQKPGFKWLLYMPTPWEQFIPNVTLLPIVLPGLKIAGSSVALKFGGGGTPGKNDGEFRGRLFGFGTELKAKTSERLLFRLDYHPLQGHDRQKSDADYIIGMGYYGSLLHIHLKR